MATRRIATTSVDSMTEFTAHAKDLLHVLHPATGKPSIEELVVLDRETLRVIAMERETLVLDEAIAAAISSGNARNLKSATLIGYGGDLARFARFVENRHNGRVLRSVGDVTRQDCIRFIKAPILYGESRVDAAGSTKRRRHAALNFMFRSLRDLGLYDGDPLLDVPLAPRDSVSYRPLIDTEIKRCEYHSCQYLDDTRGPCAFALAEATATTSEIPAVTVGDVNLETRQVWLTGGARNVGRWADLTEWGFVQIRAHLRALGDVPPTTPLVYAGAAGPTSGQASASKAVHQILARSLPTSNDAGIKPLSVPAWRGVQVYRQTGDLIAVKQTLGVRRLDVAAKIVRVSLSSEAIPPAHRTGS